MIRTMRAYSPGPAAVSVVVVASLGGWWVTSLPASSAGATVAVLGFGVAENEGHLPQDGPLGLLEIGLGCGNEHVVDKVGPGKALEDQLLAGRTQAVGAAIALLAGWELFTLLSRPRSAHPTMSSMTDPLMAHHPIRWLFFAAWAWLGWVLAR